uniref:Uncharacterized protein n=1 Tax=Timema poppense TaxID=170557 RepID=A0A7R9CUW5_TIMPO|nr:unnamed protein product [Timema poppensis]
MFIKYYFVQTSEGPLRKHACDIFLKSDKGFKITEAKYCNYLLQPHVTRHTLKRVNHTSQAKITDVQRLLTSMGHDWNSMEFYKKVLSHEQRAENVSTSGDNTEVALIAALALIARKNKLTTTGQVVKGVRIALYLGCHVVGTTSLPAVNLSFLDQSHYFIQRRNVSIYNQAVKLRLESKGIVSCLTEITTSRTYQRYIRNGEETTDCGGYGLHENLAHALQLCLLVDKMLRHYNPHRWARRLKVGPIQSGFKVTRRSKLESRLDVPKLSGITILGVGIWMHLELYKYMELSSEFSSTAPDVLLGVGALIVLVGSLACCCTVKGQPVLLYVVSTTACAPVCGEYDGVCSCMW